MCVHLCRCLTPTVEPAVLVFPDFFPRDSPLTPMWVTSTHETPDTAAWLMTLQRQTVIRRLVDSEPEVIVPADLSLCLMFAFSSKQMQKPTEKKLNSAACMSSLEQPGDTIGWLCTWLFKVEINVDSETPKDRSFTGGPFGRALSEINTREQR